MSKIAFTLVSPSAQLYSADADMIIIPAESGDMGVMAGHTPTIGTMRAGTIIVRDGGTDTRLFVEGGFLEVNEKKAIVLAEHGVLVNDIDKKQAQQQLTDSQKDFDAADESHKANAKINLDVAKARINAIENQFYA